MINKFLLAVQFITTIPVRIELDYSEQEVAASMLFYPLLGTLLGLVLAGVNYVGQLFLPPLVNGCLIVVILVLLSGGIHLDGLMDSCDGLFSGRGKERILEIMRDSRAGTFGVLAAVLVLLLKFSLIVELPGPYQFRSLLFFPAAGRWAMVYAACFHPYARKEGMGKVYAKNIERRHFIIATIWTLLLAVLLFGLQALIISLFSWFTLVLLIKGIKVKIAGLTGDSYGAINEIMETAVLMIITILL
ncbi:MAG: adenosylcobinamide-GDP ribazoletransferase [Halanaerobiales bacterium]